MKRILTHLFFIFTCFFSGLVHAAADNYTLDPTHTFVQWQINHFGFSNPSGKWMANGTLILDQAKPEDSKLTVTINVGDLVTGIPKLDEHLKSKDFFNIAQFPTATFVSNKITMTGKDTAKVDGILTVHGVSKPLTLDVKLNKLAESPLIHKMVAGFTATAELKRSDFGISAYLPGLGDDVKLHIEAEADKA